MPNKQQVQIDGLSIWVGELSERSTGLEEWFRRLSEKVVALEKQIEQFKPSANSESTPLCEQAYYSCAIDELPCKSHADGSRCVRT